MTDLLPPPPVPPLRGQACHPVPGERPGTSASLHRAWAGAGGGGEAGDPPDPAGWWVPGGHPMLRPLPEAAAALGFLCSRPPLKSSETLALRTSVRGPASTLPKPSPAGYVQGYGILLLLCPLRKASKTPNLPSPCPSALALGLEEGPFACWLLWRRGFSRMGQHPGASGGLSARKYRVGCWGSFTLGFRNSLRPGSHVAGSL